MRDECAAEYTGMLQVESSAKQKRKTQIKKETKHMANLGLPSSGKRRMYSIGYAVSGSGPESNSSATLQRGRTACVRDKMRQTNLPRLQLPPHCVAARVANQ
jgi:hypothetical protein